METLAPGMPARPVRPELGILVLDAVDGVQSPALLRLVLERIVVADQLRQPPQRDAAAGMGRQDQMPNLGAFRTPLVRAAAPQPIEDAIEKLVQSVLVVELADFGERAERVETAGITFLPLLLVLPETRSS